MSAATIAAFFVCSGPAAAVVTAYFNDPSGFNAAAGSPPVQITFDGVAPGTNITGTTLAGVTFNLGNSPPPSAQLIVVRGADTFTTAGFTGAANPATNKLFPTSGANVLSPGGVELRPGFDPLFENDDLELRFGTPVGAVGFDLLYQSLDCCSFVGITIFNPAGAVIYANPFIPSGGSGAGGPGGAEFVGFVSDSADIARIVVDEFDGDSVFPDSNVGFDTFRFVCPPGDDDLDDDGLDDRTESFLGNLLNDADTDDDGILDGNDDGDDDGVDDEDEDDGTDPCPEDGDGDGEDDEDEDDEEGDD